MKPWRLKNTNIFWGLHIHIQYIHTYIHTLYFNSNLQGSSNNELISSSMQYNMRKIYSIYLTKMLAHLTLTVRNLIPTSITSIATPPFPRSMLCVVFYTSKVLHNIDKGDRGCLDMKFCINWASIYMVIRNEVKVMLFRLSAPRIFDQDCSYYELLSQTNISTLYIMLECMVCCLWCLRAFCILHIGTPII